MATGKSEGINDPIRSQELVKRYTEDISPECENLISTLPMEMLWTNVQFCQYQGFWYLKSRIQGILNVQDHFQAHDSDIIIVTPPKCGTTWLKALTFTILNRNKYSITKSNQDLVETETIIEPHPLLTSNPHDLVPFLEINLYKNTKNPDLGSFSPPRLFASHMPYVSLPESVKQSRCKIVYLCREPKDVFISSWHFLNRLSPEVQELNTIDYLFDKFCRGVLLSGPFWDHVLGYYKESLERPEKILFLKYEELKNEPVRVLKDLADFLGHGFSEQEVNCDVISNIVRLCSFENLSNLKVNKNGTMLAGTVENKIFFRRGEIGDWKNFLSDDMIKHIDSITQEKFGKYSLKF